MSPEKEAERFANILHLVKAVADIQDTQQEHGRQLASIKARLEIMPQPPEFYELRGRVEEISRRLPTTIAWAEKPARQS